LIISLKKDNIIKLFNHTMHAVDLSR
jgi:hypothetical protein